MSRILGLLALLVCLPAFGQPTFPPATQAEVDEGILRIKFVSPATLRNWHSTNSFLSTNMALTNLTDVARYFGGLADGQVLTYNGTLMRWSNGIITASATNSFSTIQTNSATVSTVAQILNFVGGANTTVTGLVSGSTVTIGISAVTNLSAATNLYLTNQCITYVQGDTNSIIVTLAGSAVVNGAYRWSGTRWTNSSSATHNITKVGATYYFSNATQQLYYNLNNLPVGESATWFAVNGTNPPPKAVYLDATNCFINVATAGGMEFPQVSTNLYLSMTGNDQTARRGRIEYPWRNVYKALQAAVPGDTLIIGPGTYPADPESENGLEFNSDTDTVKLVKSNLKIIGSGIGTTILGADGANNQLHVGSNTVIANLTLGGFMKIGGASVSATNVTIYNCKISGLSDSIFLSSWHGGVNVFSSWLRSGYDNIADFEPRIMSNSNRVFRIFDSLIETDGRAGPARNLAGLQSRYEFYGCYLLCRNGTLGTNGNIFLDYEAPDRVGTNGSVLLSGCFLEHSHNAGLTFSIANLEPAPVVSIVGSIINTNEVYHPASLEFIGDYLTKQGVTNAAKTAVTLAAGSNVSISSSETAANITYTINAGGGGGGAGVFNSNQFTPSIDGTITNLADGVALTNANSFTSFKVMVGSGNAATNMVAASTVTTFFPQSAATGTLRVGDNSGASNARYLTFNKGTAKLSMGNGATESFSHTVSTGFTTNSGAFDNAGITRLFGTTTNYNVVNVKSNLFVDQKVYVMDSVDGLTYYGSLYAADGAVYLDSDTASVLGFIVQGVPKASVGLNSFIIQTNTILQAGLRLSGFGTGTFGKVLMGYNTSGDVFFTNVVSFAQPPSVVLSNIVGAGGAYTSVVSTAVNNSLIATNANFSLALKTISAGANVTITPQGTTNLSIAASASGGGSVGVPGQFVYNSFYTNDTFTVSTNFSFYYINQQGLGTMDCILPDASTMRGYVFWVKQSTTPTSTNIRLLPTNSPQQYIDEQTQIIFGSSYASRMIHCDGTNWWMH